MSDIFQPLSALTSINVVIPPQATATNSLSTYSNFGTNATANALNGTGNVYSVYCHNLNASARYIQLHNKTSAAGNGDVPLYTFMVAAKVGVNPGATLIDKEFFGDHGKNFTLGITFAFSTTAGTYTAGAAADQCTTIQYKS